jgi:membrane-associated phospholipid phosphatase
MSAILLATIAKLGIFIGHTPTYFTIVLVGFFTRYKPIIIRVLLLLLFTNVYNLYLKSIWQIPLPAPLEGWAFPSGHMHSAVVFWGWLAFELRKFWAIMATIVILTCIGYGLVYNGYHYPRDILGSLLFGGISIMIYGFLNRIALLKAKPYYLGIGLTGLSFLLAMGIPASARTPHMWQAWCILLGFSMGLFAAREKE